MRNKIVVVDYDPIWKDQFEELKSVLIKSIDRESIEIEHVGSTSILGLKAKPIIDLDIILEDDLLIEKVIEKLSKLGYNHVGDLGITGREAFKKTDTKTPATGTNKEWFEHHLYVCRKDSIGLQNHLNFRDYMRNHPEKVKEYGNLKLELTKKYPYDIDSYIDGKTDFIVEVLSRTGMEKEDKKQVENENRLK
ncbi:MAG: GrpB family protein [Saprospiraceae bacterium]